MYSGFQADVAGLMDGIEFRGLTAWPRPLTPQRDRRPSIFGKASFGSTITLVKHELRQVGARNARIQLALPDDQIRRDGLPRSQARPEHPGVILSFDKPRQGRLVYPCDTFTHWHANLRAVALTLEALRKPGRYGVLLAGEQYSGSKLLTAGGTVTTMTAQAAAEYLSTLAHGSPKAVPFLLLNIATVEDAYREAAKRVHPDRGGSAEQMDLLTKARDTLRAHHGLGVAR